MLEIHERQEDPSKIDEDVLQDLNDRGDAGAQSKIMERLGEIKFDCTGEQFAVEHEVRVCGQLVKIPVMSLEVEGSEGLISAEQLKEMSKTPQQRRSEKANILDKRHADKKVKRARKASSHRHRHHHRQHHHYHCHHHHHHHPPPLLPPPGPRTRNSLEVCSRGVQR